MNRTSDLAHSDGRYAPTALAEEELKQLHSAYKRAFDEYSEAAFVINDCVRRRVLLPAEAFVRRRVAYVALLDTARAVCNARRRALE